MNELFSILSQPVQVSFNKRLQLQLIALAVMLVEKGIHHHPM